MTELETLSGPLTSCSQDLLKSDGLVAQKQKDKSFQFCFGLPEKEEKG